MAAPMLFISVTPRSTTRPMQTSRTVMGPAIPTSAAPAAVAVCWAVGVRTPP